MTMVRRLSVLFLALLVFVAPARAAEKVNPAKFIEALGSAAIEGLTGADMPQPEREARFRALLTESFDLPAIGKFVLGRYWRTATPEQQAEFLQLFEDFLVKSYAVRFAKYAGERFDVLDVSREQATSAIVQTKVRRRGAEDIRVDWRVREGDNSFAIIDIIVEGVSMAVTQRSEFASVIQSRGGKVEGLLAALREKTSQGGDQSAAQ